MHHTWLPHLQTSSYKMELPNPPSTEWIAGNSRLFSRSLQQEHTWSKTRTQLVEHPPKKWNTTGTQLGHNWNKTGTCITSDGAICGWVPTKWNHQTPSLQNGLLETHDYFPGASNWNTSGTPTPEVEHNWNKTGTPAAEVQVLNAHPRSGKELEHKWDTTGT